MGFHGSGLPSIKMLGDQTRMSVSALGVLSQEVASGFNSVRIQVADADPSNIVTLFGTLDGINWVPVGSVVGNNQSLFDIQAYESIKIETTNYGGVPFGVSWRTEAYPAAFGLVDRGGDQAEITDGAVHVLAQLVDDLPGGASFTTQNIFNSISSVPAGVFQDLVSYTVPAGSQFKLFRACFGGSNIGEYELYIGGVLEAKQRTWFNGDITGEFDFTAGPKEGLAISGGTIIKIRARHGRPFVGDFEGRIYGLLITN